MTKTTRKNQRKQKIVKVWRIFHFEQRYELPEDMKSKRKSGLDYTKRFVGVNGGDEAVGYQQQMGMMANGDGLESCTLEGLYGKLVNMAASLSRAKRGFLLDAADQPLTAGQIGRLLKIQAPQMKKLIERFASVKLLERVELQEFDLAKNEPPGEPAEKQPAEKPDRSPKKTASHWISGNFRKFPEKRENPSRIGNRQKRTLKGNNKQKATIGLSADGCKKNKIEIDNGKDELAQSQAQAESQSQNQASPQSAHQADQPMPTEPKGSDAGGHRVIPFTGPPAAADYSRAGLGYGLRVYVALGYRYDTESSEGNREITSFASKHDEVLRMLSGVPPPVIDSLMVRGLHEAVKITKRKSARNRGAIWNSLMDKLAATKRKSQGTAAM